MNQEMMRIIDSIARDKNIERDVLIGDIEQAMIGALKKNYDDTEDVQVKLDVLTGEIRAVVNGAPVDVRVLGRIAAQAAKQMIIQKTRDRERTSIFEDYSNRRGTIVTGTVIRAEGGNLLVNVGRTEGFLPRSEQIPGETHQPGNRLRALILEVRDQPNQVKIILSRSHPEFIVRLFELEVPEVAEHVIEIKALAREAGYRTKVAVSSIDSKVDAVGACVGVRGSRIKNIVEELGGEKIDIVRWNESSQILIQNALKPAEVQEIALNFELGKATVVVAEEQLSLAIGKRGQNVRLASRLTGWDIDILTPAEYNKHLEVLEACLKSVAGVDDVLVDKVVAFGMISVNDIDEIGADPLVNELEVDPELAARIVEACGEESIRLEEEREAELKAKAAAEAAARAAGIDLSAGEPSAFVAEDDGQAAGESAAGAGPEAEADSAAVPRDGSAPDMPADAFADPANSPEQPVSAVEAYGGADPTPEIVVAEPPAAEPGTADESSNT
ncbi:MAG: transcription termination factor NusA [Phycisphaerales bacterium]|nr:transcription termination factor NusA [Phycisphaerales bacterium]